MIDLGEPYFRTLCGCVLLISIAVAVLTNNMILGMCVSSGLLSIASSTLYYDLI